jgi:chromosome segregation ATPase
MEVTDSVLESIRKTVVDRADRTESQIEALKVELVADIRELSSKIDDVTKSHFALADRVTRLESCVAVVDESRKEQGRRIGTVENAVAVLQAHDQGKKEESKRVAEWVKWTPGLIFGGAALLVSLLSRIKWQ